MDHSTNQSIIETTVNNAIKRIQNDPERSIRNIVDMALMFSNGRFQKKFFEIAQHMLENENSSFYSMIPSVIANVDSKRITTFGINLGYHSCTKGARIIRKTEEEGYNVPWCIALELKQTIYHQEKESYFSLIEQGQTLGIYTWFINPFSNMLATLELAEHFSDSAFIIICKPTDISETLLDEFSEIYNVFFALNYEDGIENACTLLRKRKFLFSIAYKYQKDDIANILNHSFLYDFSSLHSIFSIFYADSDCPHETRKQVYDYVQRMRFEQCFQTIPFDLIYDIQLIDEIISGDSVSIYFDADGIGHSNAVTASDLICNFFQLPLASILKQLAPKL